MDGFKPVKAILEFRDVGEEVAHEDLFDGGGQREARRRGGGDCQRFKRGGRGNINGECPPPAAHHRVETVGEGGKEGGG